MWLLRRNALLVLEFGCDVLSGVTGFIPKSAGRARQGVTETCISTAAAQPWGLDEGCGTRGAGLSPAVPAKDVHAASQTAYVLSSASSFRSFSGIFLLSDSFFPFEWTVISRVLGPCDSLLLLFVVELNIWL